MSGSISGNNIDLLTITTPLSATAFEIDGLTGVERINRPFEYQAQLHSGSALLDPTQLLDNVVTIAIGDPTGIGRYVSGVVRSVSQMPSESAVLWRYSLTIVPKLWFLGQTSDCRFYYNQTVPQIVSDILSAYNVAFTNKLQGSYSTRVYTVMFNESYLHFVQRLLEDEGIFYFFEFADGAHTMILADANTAFQAINNPEIVLADQGSQWLGLSTIARTDSTALGLVMVDDYNPETDALTVGALRGVETANIEGLALPSDFSSRTHYSWPAVRGTTADAQARAKWRIQAAEAASQMYRGTGGQVDFYAGGSFTLTNDPTGINSYVIHTVSYQLTDLARTSTSPGVSRVAMSFTAFPMSTTWREEPSTRQPDMSGLYSGKVIGPQGEEIYTDSLGRIQVWFPWDENSDIKPEQTFWARVVQPWAGVGWGHQFIPRVGMEVAVAFLEGDVNRPVVVGSLFNNVNTPIYPVAKKNIGGFRTRSTKNGGAANYNELSWDDTMGSELFFLHAEKDYYLETENNQTLQIDNCRIVTVNKDETVTIKGKQTITVTGDQTIEVKQGDHKTTIDQGKHSTIVSLGDQEITVSTGKQTTTVQGDQEETVNEGDQKVTVSKGDRKITVSEGDNKLDVTAGSIKYTAGQSIVLTVGGNSLKIDTSGITVNGMMFKLSANGMGQVSASGPLTLQGALVKIN